MFYPSTASVWKIRDLINKKLYHTGALVKRGLNSPGLLFRCMIPSEKDPRATLAGELPIFDYSSDTGRGRKKIMAGREKLLTVFYRSINIMP